MKKVLVLIAVIILALILSPYLQMGDVDDAKKQLWVNHQENVSQNDQVSQEKPSVKETEKQEAISKEDVLLENKEESVSKSSYVVESLTEDQFLEIDDLSSQVENSVDHIKITWKTLTQVDKVIFSFSNRDSDFPLDRYQLTQFKSWDDSFTYNASRSFKVLDYGVNEYIIEAYSWDKISKLKLTITIINKEEKNQKTEEIPEKLSSDISYEKKLVWEWEDQLYLSFPSSDIFGNPINLWDDTITYTNINNLSIKTREVSKEDVECSTVTDYLVSNLGWWFYWNTCRDIIAWDGISIYVIRLDWDNYVYEKHYIDYKHNLYWVYEIRSGIAADKENIASEIAEKNAELREMNEEFDEVDIVDDLFREIVR